MQEQIYKYRFKRRVWILSLAAIVLFALLGVGLYYFTAGEYFSAWFASFVVALLILMLLSVPRRIRLDANRLRIDCLMDMTEWPVSEILSVRRISKREMRGVIPLFGSWGFFGYFGYYLDVVQVERLLLYASEWDNFVEIVNIYEERLVVSCSDPDRLVEALQGLIPREAE